MAQVSGRPQSQARIYADVNAHQPPEYWDYEKHVLKFSTATDYEVCRKLGRGKYSEVFEGRHRPTGKKCVIKVLKPVRKKKIRRECMVLKHLCGAPNCAQLIDVCRDRITDTPALIMDWFECDEFRDLYPKLTDFDIRYYMYELLKGLDYAHSKGIMHRDLKPQNVLIHHRSRSLRIIDWGLAEFYHPLNDYNIRVASRYFKAPELLTDMRMYDYSLDLWSVGCIHAGLIFDSEPFFRGADNNDQLVKIAQVLGTDGLMEYLEKYDLTLNSSFDGSLGRFSKKPWTRFVTERNRRRVNQEALDFLDGLLRYDHSERMTCKEAMNHPYMEPVRKYWRKKGGLDGSPAAKGANGSSTKGKKKVAKKKKQPPFLKLDQTN